MMVILINFTMDGILNGSLSLVRGTTYIFNVANSNNTGQSVIKFILRRMVHIVVVSNTLPG